MLDASPRTSADVIRSHVNNALTVERLRKAPRAYRCPEKLRAAVATHGTVAAAGRALGWPDPAAHRVASEHGIKGDPKAVLAAMNAGRMKRAQMTGATMAACLARMGPHDEEWLSVYQAVKAGLLEREPHVGWAVYRATKAADAAVWADYDDATHAADAAILSGGAG